MVNYADLADSAKKMQDAGKSASITHKELRVDPCAFFDGVKAHLATEMKKANVELRKRGAAAIDQNHLPGFDTEIFLTFGTDSLCRIGLGIKAGECRITAVISGPPNGYEISRKEYLCLQEAACKEVLAAAEAGLPNAGAYSPREIAADIISSFLLGKFD
ncbi:MAG: hypothetical protein WAK26_13415 [Terracidiphilus sp.]|jgi:hypothetical protein